MSTKIPEAYNLNKKVARTYKRIKELFRYISDENVIVAYSGGKDSTLVLHFLLRLLEENPTLVKTKVHIVYSDTGVEIPAYSQYVYSFLDRLKKWIELKSLNEVIKISIIRPLPTESFWYNIIVKGYPAPTYLFRWCTKRLKISPMRRYISQNLPAVLLLGSRATESSTRSKSLKKRKLSKLWTRYDDVPGVKAFLPVVDWDDADVIKYLKISKTPWGDSYDDLLTLYEKAAFCNNNEKSSCRWPRFGCWVCTVIKKDRTLLGLSANGDPLAKELYLFKQYLFVETRKPENRILLPTGRYSKIKPQVRLKLFNELVKFQKRIKHKYGVEIISDSELELIRRDLRRYVLGDKNDDSI